MYAQTIALFAKTLTNLEALLGKAEEHAKAKNFDVQVLMDARLAPDMYPFVRQVQAACDAAKFAAARLAAQTPPVHPDTEKTLDEVRARIKTCVAYLESVDAKAYAGADARIVPLGWMPGQGLVGPDYLMHLAVPNFFFHVTTAYAILRHNGVPLGKADFIGSLDFKAL